MIIGDPINQWVTTDTAGVPSGGAYGDVPRFQRELQSRGMDLAWSWLPNSFFVFHYRGSKPVPLWHCWHVRKNQPQPLCDELLGFLTMCYDRFCRHGVKSIQKAAMDVEREQKARVAKELYELRAMQVKDATEKIGRRVGFAPRRIISVPSVIGAGRASEN